MVFPNAAPANLPRPNCRRRISVDSKASFQREYGFIIDRKVLNASSVPLAFTDPVNAVHRIKRLDLGTMTHQCPHCHALHWQTERDRTSGLSSTSFEKCCKKGIVRLTLFQDPPLELRHLLESDRP